MKIELEVNGRLEQADVATDEVLLDTLRERFHLHGAKDGCREGECGACTVLVDGDPVVACLYPSGLAHGRHVETIEGLGVEHATSIQAALLKRGGVQCGFCSPGVVMVLEALRRKNPNPSAEEVRSALVGNLCRCTGYAAMVAAAQGAAETRGGS